MKKIMTMSDVGGVRIGNDDFAVTISTGSDGKKYIFVSENEKESEGLYNLNRKKLKYAAFIKCKNAKIFDYDCEGSCGTSINGEYFVYTNFDDQEVYFCKLYRIGNKL